MVVMLVAQSNLILTLASSTDCGLDRRFTTRPCGPCLSQQTRAESFTQFVSNPRACLITVKIAYCFECGSLSLPPVINREKEGNNVFPWKAVAHLSLIRCFAGGDGPHGLSSLK